MKTAARFTRRKIAHVAALPFTLCVRCKSTAATFTPTHEQVAPAIPTAVDLQPTIIDRRTRSVYRDGQYHNPWPTFKEKTLRDRVSDLKHWLNDPKAYPLRPSTYEHYQSFPAPYNTLDEIDLDEHLPVVTPNFDRIASQSLDVSSQSMTHTWIGHATCLVQLGSLTILTDPWFSERPSAWQRVGPRRIRPPACSISDLPPLDLILISHNHFDHLDYHSTSELCKRVSEQEHLTGRACRWFVPLGLSAWLQRWARVPADHITELDWWQRADHRHSLSSAHSFSVTAVGAQHWTSRLALLDNRWQLWCGFIVEHNDRRYYFTGDSGYCPVFKEIGHHHPNIDLASIPCGAYAPRWLLEGAHVNPNEAVRIHRDVRAVRSFAIHWGTVLLSDEMVMEPKIELERAAKTMGLADDEFTATKHGETMLID